METLFGECGRRTVVFMFIVSATSIATTIAFNHERFRVSGLACNFDESWCGWRNALQTDDFNWKHGSGGAGRQKGSGTNDDHGGGGGYLYIRSRNKGNRTARIYSARKVNVTEDACFQFWYFMRGQTLGHLEVLLGQLTADGQKRGEITIWNLRGHQGNQWKLANIPIEAGTVGFFIIEAFDWERGKSGNILIDDTDLVARTSSCANVIPQYAEPVRTNKTASTTTTTTTTPVLTLSTTRVSPISVVSKPNPSTSEQVISSSATQPPSQDSKGTVVAFKSTFSDSSLTTRKYFINSSNFPSVSTKKLSNFTINNFSRKTASKSFTKPYYFSNKTLGPTKSDPSITLGLAESPSAASSSTGIAVGVTIGVLVACILAVALVIYLRKRKQRRFEQNCSVVMTRMYPDITVNTNISFQKLT